MVCDLFFLLDTQEVGWGKEMLEWQLIRKMFTQGMDFSRFAALSYLMILDHL